MVKFKLVLVAAAVAALAGCATQPPQEPPKADPSTAILERIADASQKASQSMQRLASLEAGRPGAKAVELVAPEGLDVPVSITWTGPIDSLVKKIAEVTGYTYEGVIGAKPVVPVNVSIAVSNVSAFHVLADAGAQAGTAADIVVRPDSKKLLIKYPPTTPNGGYVQAK